MQNIHVEYITRTMTQLFEKIMFLLIDKLAYDECSISIEYSKTCLKQKIFTVPVKKLSKQYIKNLYAAEPVYKGNGKKCWSREPEIIEKNLGTCEGKL